MIRNFREKGPRQFLAGSEMIGNVKKLSEGNELDDVPSSLAATEGQDLLVAIEFVHRIEICVPDADDDDGYGQIRRIH